MIYCAFHFLNFATKRKIIAAFHILKNPSSADTGGIFLVPIIPYQGLTGDYNYGPDKEQFGANYTIPRIDRGLQLHCR